MDSYQPIYDAVRSKITGGSFSDAVQAAVSNSGIGHAVEMVRYSWQEAAASQERPCVLFKPAIYMDGDQWCALYGEDLMAGVAGFGDSPNEAMFEFDKAWAKKIEPQP